MAKKRYYEHDKGMNKKMEYEDSMMISEDLNATANLPQNVIKKKYPRESQYYDGRLNDGISGIDHQIKEDVKGLKKSSKGGKNPSQF